MTSLILAIVLVLGFLSTPEDVFAAAARKETHHRLRRHERAGLLRSGRRASAAFSPSTAFDAETLFVRGAPTLVSAMASNDIEVGYTGGTAVIGAVASGADLKVLSALTNRVTYDFVVRPGIKSPEDLRGKKFGVQAIGGTVWMGAILALEHLGLDPERDKIAIIAAGDQTVLAQALASGTIDATVLDGVQSRPLHARGFPILAELDKARLPILSSSIVVREPTCKKTRRSSRTLLRAVIEGAAFCLSAAQKPNTLKILQKYLRITEKDAEEGYRDMVTGLDRKPYALPAGVTNVIRLMKRSNPKVENVKPGNSDRRPDNEEARPERVHR